VRLRAALLGVLLCAACAPAPVAAVPATVDRDNPGTWPRTCAAATAHIAGEMSAEDRASPRQVRQDERIRYHHGWGMGIGNDFGLWNGNTALARDCVRTRGTAPDSRTLDPDTVSMPIIHGVWSAVR
jgi:hypothetical protein